MHTSSLLTDILHQDENIDHFLNDLLDQNYTEYDVHHGCLVLICFCFLFRVNKVVWTMTILMTTLKVSRQWKIVGVNSHHQPRGGERFFLRQSKLEA